MYIARHLQTQMYSLAQGTGPSLVVPFLSHYMRNSPAKDLPCNKDLLNFASKGSTHLHSFLWYDYSCVRMFPAMNDAPAVFLLNYVNYQIHFHLHLL